MKIRYKHHLVRVKQKMPTFMTFISVAGLVLTAASAINDTPKALKMIKKEEEHRNWENKVSGKTQEVLNKTDIFKITWKCYIPTISIGLATILCILSIDILNKQNQKAIISAYTLLNQSYKEYRNKIIQLIGEEKEQDIRNDIAHDHIKDMDLENGKIFVDEFMKIPFYSTMEKVLEAEYELNRLFVLREYVSLGDFYRLLELDEIADNAGGLSEKFGWSWDVGTDMGYEWIDFTHREMEDGSCIIGYPFEPVLEFLNPYWFDETDMNGIIEDRIELINNKQVEYVSGFHTKNKEE